MPLTSKTKVYRHLPQDLADSVVQARSAKSNRKSKGKPLSDDDQRKENLKKKHEPNPETHSSSEEPSTTKRQRTPRGDTSSDCSTPMSTLSDDQEVSTLLGENIHPLTMTRVTRPPSAMEVDSRNSSSRSSHVLRPRLQRCESQTTMSLDNVEIWESDSELDTVDTNFDKINGVMINPRKTFDFSDLSRMRSSSTSPRLVQTIPPSRSPVSTPSPRNQTRQITPKKRRPPKLSLPMTMLGSDACSPVISENRLSADPKIVCNRVMPKDNTKKFEKKDPKSSFDTYVKDSLPCASISASARLRSPAGGALSLAISRRNSNRTLTGENSTLCKTPTKSGKPTDHARKVKFNNFVTITDGENNSTDILRSSRNSAQLIKQKYLGPDSWKPQSPIDREESHTEVWEVVF